MGLFGGKTKLELVVEPVRLAPGDELRARVNVDGLDGKARDGWVRLLYVNTYRYEGRDSDGDRTTSTRSEDVVLAEAPLFGTGGAPAEGSFAVVLRVPAAAPPSAADAVECKVVASVDRKGGRDANEDVGIEMASAPDAYADRIEIPVAQPEDFTALIDAAPRALRAGETVSGTVQVTAPSGLEGKAVRVRVRGLRRDHDGLTTAYEGDEQVLAEPAKLEAGAPQSFAFSVAVPADARPTFEAANNSLDWHLEVLIDRRMRADPTARLPLVVRA